MAGAVLNDHDAMEAVDAVLEQYFRGRLNPYEALNQIAQITGANKIEHEADQ